MKRLLYAANSYPSSNAALTRFLSSFSAFYEIKVAGYSSSLKEGEYLNWNLDALLDFRKQFNRLSFKNSNFSLLKRAVKSFAPDLIISDCELFVSTIALELGLPLIQVSPFLLYHGTPEKLFLRTHYSSIIRDIVKSRRVNDVLSYSKKRLILSHLGDLEERPALHPGYEFCRPNYEAPGGISPSSAIGLADAFYHGTKLNIEADYNDPQSIVVSQFAQHYQGPINLREDVLFLSQHLSALL